VFCLLYLSFFPLQVFRLVSRGTLEEQKYLRQVYKTQLKNETMVDIDDPERGKAARLFRGVAKDSSRRGELFGLSNLLRYEDGTIMKYGVEAKEATKFGGGIYNMESVVAAANKTVSKDEDDDDDDDVDFDAMTSGVADLAKRSEKSTLPMA
jgi:DNA excision repair protein ERCC-6-like 2